jgi:hypothetical protein
VSVTPGPRPKLSVRGIVDEAMLFSPQFRLDTTISTELGSNTFTIEDTIINLKSVPAEMQLLYHCNFGAPFLEKGSKLVLPVKEVAPRDPFAALDIKTWNVYRGPTTGFAEQCHWFIPQTDARGNTLAMLQNAKASKAVVVRFNRKQLPYMTQWKCCGAVSDGYVTGLEPATNLPNVRSFERTRGRTVMMKPGAKYLSKLVIDVCDTPAAVKAIKKEVARIQGKTAPRVHKTPQPKFSQV